MILVGGVQNLNSSEPLRRLASHYPDTLVVMVGNSGGRRKFEIEILFERFNSSLACCALTVQIFHVKLL